MPVLSHPSTPSSPPTGVRREAGGVHVAEEVCVGPQADTHASSCAAYRQPSATVTDSRLVTSQAAGAVDGSETTTHTARSNDSIVQRPLTLNDGGVPVRRQLPKAVLAELSPLSHQPRRLPVIADGRCSVASVLLACKMIDDAHINEPGRQTIDAERRRLGKVMVDKWTEADWIRRVPIHVRGAHMPFVNPADKTDNRRHQSHKRYHQLLTVAPPTTWLDHAVFYLASAEYNLCIFVIYAGDSGQWNCERIGGESDRHVVLYHARGHYECVEYDGLRQFPSTHEFVVQMSRFAAQHPGYPYEEDVELLTLEAQNGVRARTAAADVPTRPATDSAARVSNGDRTLPLLMATPRAARQQWNDKEEERHGTEDETGPPTRRVSLARKAKEPKRSNPALERGASALPVVKLSGVMRRHGSLRRTSTEPDERKLVATIPLPATGSLPLSPADIAAHGELYDFISFANVPQWIGMCTLVLNAYRIASQGGDRDAQDQALEDLLMLPQRVLTRTNRGGGDGRRLTQIIKARCRDNGAKLRARYHCMPAKDHSLQLTVTTTPLLHQRVPSRAGSNPSTADTDVDSESDSDGTGLTSSDSEDDPLLSLSGSTLAPFAASPTEGVADALEEDHISNGEEELGGNYVRAFLRAMEPEGDLDHKAAKRAQHHMRQGHFRKAAQVLHSTATMADLRQPAVQDAIRRLHPALPVGSVLPSLPADSPQMILEDDEVMCSILRASNNGSASGPSGWGGNLLSSLVESDLCRAGVIALLKDIINGSMSERARQMLLSSRLVALNKTDGGHRPIAVGELFYRLAGVIVVRKITKAAAVLFSPHQFGVGIPAGAERILHSLQHLLTDQSNRVCLLKVDISNAFNSCDRARMLRELYSTPALSPLYRIADFGYSAPSQLILQRCEGLSMSSSNGVRQGDPISAILFCLYMREVMVKVAEQADVCLYGFFDDLNVVGKPDEVMKAFAALQQLLPQVSLECNTSKSHFAYFHHEDAPLKRSIRNALAEHNIQLHDEWMEVVGAVIGRDEQAIRAGVTATLGAHDHGRDAFFYRLQLDVLTEHSCMNLLRQCAVPKMNYLLRCLPPPCVREEAKVFDELVLEAAKAKIGIHGDEGGETTTLGLQTRLRHGGFGMTSASETSPKAYLGSLAAVSGASAFERYSGDGYTPLPSESMLHGWITDSMKAVTDVTPASSGELPESASSFFHHFSKSSSSLQHMLSKLASEHSHEASVKRAHAMKKKDGGLAISLLRAISAPHAWAWKTVIPASKELELTSAEYKMAARLNLGLKPLAGVEALGEGCPLCHQPTALRDDHWHFLTCKKVQGGEQIRRHNGVVNALYKTALIIGAQVVREPVKLSAGDGRRPDLQIVLPGRHILADVAVCHPLTQRVAKHGLAWTATGVAREKERTKRKKYSGTATLHGAEFLPFVVETCGGMAPDAVALVRVLAEAGQQYAAMWPRNDVIRHIVGSVAIATQRGMAMTYLTGYSQALARLGVSKQPAVGVEGSGM